MKMRIRKRRAAGISFTEVLVTLLVVAIGVLPIFAVFSQSSSGTIRNRDEILAQTYAEELLDLSLAKGFAAVEPTAATGVAVPEVEAGGVRTKMDSRFTRTLVVREIGPAAHHDDWPLTYRLVGVIVTWSHEGRPRRLVRSGLLFRGAGL